MARFRDTLLRLLGSSSGETTLKAAATAGGTITVPALTDTLATLGTAQTFTAEQTFNEGGTNVLKIAAGTALTTYNIVSFNGVKTSAGMLGLLGGGGTDNWLYAFTPTGGGFRVAVNGSTVCDIDGGGLSLRGSSSGALVVKPPAAAGTNTVTLPAGTTDFSGTGGTSQVVKQTSAGGAFSVARLAAADLSDQTTWTNETPTVTAGSGTFTTVSGTQRWFKIGKLVMVIGQITITTNGTAGSYVLVTFPTGPGAASGSPLGYGRGGVVSGKMLQMVASSSTQMAILNYDNSYPGASGEILEFQYCFEVS